MISWEGSRPAPDEPSGPDGLKRLCCHFTEEDCIILLKACIAAGCPPHRLFAVVMQWCGGTMNPLVLVKVCIEGGIPVPSRSTP